MGSLMERGTEPSAAWWDTKSMPSTAFCRCPNRGYRPPWIRKLDGFQRLWGFPCSLWPGLSSTRTFSHHFKEAFTRLAANKSGTTCNQETIIWEVLSMVRECRALLTIEWQNKVFFGLGAVSLSGLRSKSYREPVSSEWVAKQAVSRTRQFEWVAEASRIENS